MPAVLPSRTRLSVSWKKQPGLLKQMLSEPQLSEFINEQPAVGEVEYNFKHALT
jgi:hypothetical protein